MEGGAFLGAEVEIISLTKRKPFILRSMYPWVGLWQWVGENGS